IADRGELIAARFERSLSVPKFDQLFLAKGTPFGRTKENQHNALLSCDRGKIGRFASGIGRMKRRDLRTSCRTHVKGVCGRRPEQRDGCKNLNELHAYLLVCRRISSQS